VEEEPGNVIRGFQDEMTRDIPHCILELLAIQTEAVVVVEIHREEEAEHQLVGVEGRQEQLVAAVVLLLLADNTDSRQRNSDIHRMQRMDPDPRSIGHSNLLDFLLLEHQVLKW
jgi:hypothetical protein